MSLLDRVEMVCDWKAAGERHDPVTPFAAALAHNAGSGLKIGEQLTSILAATAIELGWMGSSTGTPTPG